MSKVETEEQKNLFEESSLISNETRIAVHVNPGLV